MSKKRKPGELSDLAKSMEASILKQVQFPTGFRTPSERWLVRHTAQTPKGCWVIDLKGRRFDGKTVQEAVDKLLAANRRKEVIIQLPLFPLEAAA